MADTRITDLTEETSPAANDELVMYDVTGTDDNKIEIQYLNKVHCGTAFPTTDLYDGYLFHRTNIGAGMLCFYDLTNTQWLTVAEYTTSVTRSGISSAEERRLAYMRSDYVAYFTNVAIATSVATTNDGSNYWTVKLQGENLAGDTESDITSVTTAADSADAWTDHTEAADTPSPTNKSHIISDVAKTGSPGNIDYEITAHWRYIIT